MYSHLTGCVLPSIRGITDIISSLCTALYAITEYFGTLHYFTIHHLNLVFKVCYNYMHKYSKYSS